MTKIAKTVFDTTNELAQLLNDRSIDDLDAEDFASAITIIRSLSQCVDSIESTSSLLSAMISSNDPMARIASANLLSKLKGQDQEPLLSVVSAAATSDDLYCRRLAAETMGYLEAVGGSILPIALRDTDEKVRHFGLMAVHRLGPHATPATPALVEILCQEDGPESDEIPQLYFRMDACDALREIGPGAKQAVPHLLSIIAEQFSDEDHRWLQLRAAHALFAITGDPSEGVKVALAILENETHGHIEHTNGSDKNPDLTYWLKCRACDVLEEICPDDPSVRSRIEVILNPGNKV